MSQRVTLIGDERVEIECASVRYDHATWRRIYGAGSHGQDEMTAPATVTLGEVKLAERQIIQRGDWTQLTWDEADQVRLTRQIHGPFRSAGDGFPFTLISVQAEL